jgi:NAD(P)-dependent dehydrogenase (short-subunit alcohol dehydrogenase family)
VLELASRGAPVFAGVRNAGDAPGQAHEILLDITQSEQIASVPAQVRQLASEHGLRAVVNNAGTALPGPLEYASIDDVRRQFEVNVFGHLAVTQAVLELIRAHGDGRIVFTGSVAGRVAAPCAGPYAASKHAVNGMADSLRRELRPSGIHVSTIAPGAVMTPIWDKVAAGAEGLEHRMPMRGLQLYSAALKDMDAYAKLAKRGWGLSPAAVARAALHAIYAPRPRAVYLVGAEAQMGVRMSAALPARTFDTVLAQMGTVLAKALGT